MKSDADELVANSPNRIRLTLQFEIGDGLNDDGHFRKEISIDLEPVSDRNMGGSPNPIHVINAATASIIRLLAGSPSHEGVFSVGTDNSHIAEKQLEINVEDFTPREGDVFRLLVQGATNKEIAHDLNISENTVKYHVKNIMQKLEINRRTQIAVRLRK